MSWGVKITSWWAALSERERVIVSCGSVIAIFLFFYFMLWSPLSAAVDAAKAELAENSQELTVVNAIASRILAFRQAGVVPHVDRSVSVMALLERALAEDQLAKYIRQVQQPQKGQVQVMLQSVPFDHFISCLQRLERRAGVSVKKLTAKKTSRLGVVDVQFTLMRSEV